jgi:hypothetical protein
MGLYPRMDGRSGIAGSREGMVKKVSPRKACESQMTGSTVLLVLAGVRILEC